MKKPSKSNRLLLVTAFAASLCSGQSQTKDVSVEELQKLPVVELNRKNEFQAQIRELPSGDPDQRRYGFAFRTPELIEGPATWLVLWDHEKPDTAAWTVTFADGRTLDVVSPLPEELAKYPELTKKSPKAGSLQMVRVPAFKLNKWDRYHAVITTSSKTPPLSISINAAADGIVKSSEGTLGKVKIPEGVLDAPLVMELVEGIRGKEGGDTAIRFLEAQFSEKAQRMSGFDTLFLKVWNEAQFGTGRESREWGSRLNDAAFTSAFRAGHYARAFEILNNLCACLGSSARFGRLAEVHAILADSYRKGGLNMDPTTYPDLGPAIPSLPAIRHRNIPAPTPFANGFPAGSQVISRPPAFDDKAAGALSSYAYQLALRGEWKQGIEWMVWIRDWASDDTGKPIQARNETWYDATMSIAMRLESHGYIDDALALIEEADAAPYGRNYRGRAKINVSRMLLSLKRQAGRPDPEAVTKLRELITTMENHIHFGKGSSQGVKVNLAQALIETGQIQEGEELLDRLVEEGSYSARWARVGRWIEKGRTEGVEADLIQLLQTTRENGHKLSEIGLYGMYADFLESVGRYEEALAMRREAIQLARKFGGFTSLPVNLAKLSALLLSLGEDKLAADASADARKLLLQEPMPASIAEQVGKILSAAKRPSPDSNVAGNKQPAVDLQPHRGLVIPLEGVPWTGYLTLANPGSTAVGGTLEISGAPIAATEDVETGDIRVSLSKAGESFAALELSLAPGSYRMVTITGKAEGGDDGELSLAWRSDDKAKGDEARILIDSREKGVAGAVIQAGNYQANPFYGVPIHLSYVAKDQRTKSSPIRIVASQKTRIEIYGLDGTPLAVDGTGNGTLLDAGDELFSETDGAGNLLLGLKDGSAALRIIAYPAGAIGEEGISLDVEVLDGGPWILHSRNRIEQ